MTYKRVAIKDLHEDPANVRGHGERNLTGGKAKRIKR